ncbi:uncharacterized protein LOC144356279 [Saccoglossus kowalevskii]
MNYLHVFICCQLVASCSALQVVDGVVHNVTIDNITTSSFTVHLVNIAEHNVSYVIEYSQLESEDETIEHITVNDTEEIDITFSHLSFNTYYNVCVLAYQYERFTGSGCAIVDTKYEPIKQQGCRRDIRRSRFDDITDNGDSLASRYKRRPGDN